MSILMLTSILQEKWYVLSMLSVLALTHGMSMVTFMGIPVCSEQYFQMSTFELNLLFNWSTIMFIVGLPYAIWFVSRTTIIRDAIRQGCACVLVGNIVRSIPVLLHPTNHWELTSSSQMGTVGSDYYVPVSWLDHIFLHLGQMIASLAGPIMFSLPTKVASVWFPPNERLIASATMLVVNCLSEALGLLIGPLMVTHCEQIQTLLFSNILIALPPVVMTMVYLQPYPSHGSQPSQIDHFWTVLKKTVLKPKLLVLSTSAGISLGVSIAWEVMLPQILEGMYTPPVIGWICFGYLVVVAVSCLLASLIVSRCFPRRMFESLIIEELIATLSLVWVIVSLPTPFDPTPLIRGVLASLVVSALALGSQGALFFDLVMMVLNQNSGELNESISSLMISVMSAITTFICLIIFSSLPITYITLITVGFYVISPILTIVVAVIWWSQQRTRSPQSHSTDVDGIEIITCEEKPDR